MSKLTNIEECEAIPHTTIHAAQEEVAMNDSVFMVWESNYDPDADDEGREPFGTPIPWPQTYRTEEGAKAAIAKERTNRIEEEYADGTCKFGVVKISPHD